MRILLVMMLMTVTLCGDQYVDYLESRIAELTHQIDSYDSKMCWGQLTYMLGQRDGYAEALWEYNQDEPYDPGWGIPD